MKLSNSLALCALMAASYWMYAMQVGESSSSPSSSKTASAELLTQVRTLEEQSTTVIARQLHDNKFSFKLKGVATRFDELPEFMQETIAREYYRLYPDEFKPQLVQTIDSKLSSGPIRFSPDGQRLFAFDYASPSLVTWSLGDDGVFQSSSNLGMGAEPFLPIMNAMGDRIITLPIVARSDNAKIWTLQDDNTFKEGQTLAISTLCAAFSPDGKLLIGYVRNGNVKIWSQNSNNDPYTQLQDLFLGPIGVIDSIAVSSNNNCLAFCTGGIIQIWSRESGNTIFKLAQTIPQTESDHVIFSPDNKQLFYSSRNEGKITVLTKKKDTDTFQDPRPLAAPDGNIADQGYQLAFRPQDSNFFVSLAPSSLRAIKMWRKDTKSNAFKLVDTIYSVAPITESDITFSPDGDYLAYLCTTGRSYHSVVQIWQMRPTDQQVLDSLIARSLATTPAAISERLKAIVNEKKTIKASTALSATEKETQLNVLRQEEARLKRECSQNATSCSVQ